jgi:nucleotide-binding universal stress UspA family protein
MNSLDSTAHKDIILVPTDFSEVCENAALHAAKLAKALDHKLVLLHIIDTKSKGKLKKKNTGPEYLEEQLSKYKSFYEKNHGITVETLMKEGDIFTTINKTASDIRARVMIVGTHGKKGLQFLTGSYIMKLADKSPVPVIVVQNRPFHGNYKNILMPLTDEIHPDKKIAWARYFALLFNASIHLLEYSHKDKVRKDRLADLKEKLISRFEKDGIPFTFTRADKERRFASQVIDYAVSRRCDMVFIIDVNHAVDTAAWYESLLFHREEIPVMTINLARVKKPE